jgi:hypothetical protein
MPWISKSHEIRLSVCGGSDRHRSQVCASEIAMLCQEPLLASETSTAFLVRDKMVRWKVEVGGL